MRSALGLSSDPLGTFKPGILSRVGYFPHLLSGIGLGFKMIYLGLTSILHGLVPAWFEGDALLGVAKLFYRKVYHHPNPEFQKHTQEEKVAAERQHHAA